MTGSASVTQTEANEVEEEDIGSDVISSKPWDPSKIRVITKTFSLRQIIDDINDKTIDLAPDFQREYVWKDKQKTLLIESILLGIPLPAFYFNASIDNTFQVVDGIQRLSTLRDFAKDNFALSDDLEYLKDLSKMLFSDLDASLKRRIHQTQIVAHVIEPSSPLDLKYDIFKRINTGGSPLVPQEIRHCMSRSRSRNFLKELATNELFKGLTRLAKPRRMEDREMVLRFVSFYRLMQSESKLQGYSNFETLDGFLLRNTADLDDINIVSDQELSSIKMHFEVAMRNAEAVFDRHAFRKWPADSEYMAPLNKALFDSWSVVLSLRASPIANTEADMIRMTARNMMAEDVHYLDSISYGTGTLNKVIERFEIAQRIVNSFSEAEV